MRAPTLKAAKAGARQAIAPGPLLGELPAQHGRGLVDLPRRQIAELPEGSGLQHEFGVLLHVDRDEHGMEAVGPMIERVQNSLLEPLSQEERTFLLEILLKLAEANNGRTRAPLRPFV